MCDIINKLLTSHIYHTYMCDIYNLLYLSYQPEIRTTTTRIKRVIRFILLVY